MQLSPNVEGQGVPFDSKGEPQQHIQTRLNSFNPLSVCPLLLSSKIWIWLNGCTTQPENRCHLFVLSVPGFSVRHGDKCTHMHTLKHSVMVMMNQCQNLYHWVISKGTCLQVLMWGALVYYSAVLISGWTCHILSPVWKIHSPVCWGPQGTLISGTIALLAFGQGMTSLFTLNGRKVQVEEFIFLCVRFEWTWGQWRDVHKRFMLKLVHLTIERLTQNLMFLKIYEQEMWRIFLLW